ncbi:MULTISPECIES: transcriptional regulator NrdR [Aminobacterium]|jgi:transcriptional repressor NrdR|uniref:transcriptional regulator NrdR n=1 Tax=Aminobacterium TaxID=81466 RepID=UPI000466839B|nr:MULTISPECIES: transcriptional regulator NrdR [Aminobacterium]
MRCPKCSAMETRVIETRTADEGRVVRRRRECPECLARFTTYERIEEKRTLRVVKKDGRREIFDREKITRGISKACEKLPVSLEQIEEVVSRIEEGFRASGVGEIPVSIIGERVMEELKHLNKVAYVRFASVYREFTDLSSFQKEITRLVTEREP